MSFYGILDSCSVIGQGKFHRESVKLAFKEWMDENIKERHKSSVGYI